MSELKPISAIEAAKFLREASHYFERRPTGGEDSVFWANVTNAETCTRIAEMLERVFDFDTPEPTESSSLARQKGERVS